MTDPQSSRPAFSRRNVHRRGVHVSQKWGLVLLVIPLLLALACQPAEEETAAAPEETEPVLGAISSNDQNCAADPTWITDPSEADATGFNATSNCSFHQWAYQNFLWLTSPDAAAPGDLVFESFANPNDLFKPGGPTGPYPGRAADAPIRFLARVEKSQTTVDVEDIFQAGPGGKILVDQNGEVVYYSNHINKAYWDFIVDHQFYELANLQNADPALDFPTSNSIPDDHSLSLELKVSWRVAVKNGEVLIDKAAERFFTLDATIPEVTVNEQGRIVEGDEISATMAMVGMHVTGIVKGHPEFIWGTFEHIDNAPDCADDSAQPAADGPGPTGPWSFYKPGTPTGQSNMFDMNNPLGVVNVCLVHPEGGGSDDNKNAVTTLNANVRAEETDGSLWTQYELGGAVWTNGDVPVNNGAFPPDAPEGATQLGSLDLANTTMETFTQNDNCFACHNGGGHEVVVQMGDGSEKATEVNPKNINLSHYVVNYQAVQQAKADQ